MEFAVLMDFAAPSEGALDRRSDGKERRRTNGLADRPAATAPGEGLMDFAVLVQRALDRRSDDKERRRANGLGTVPSPPPLEKN